MLEQSKAARRRFFNGNFHNLYFNGNGIDIGGKLDPFSQYIGVFPLVKDVKIWDLEDGDAQLMESCNDESYNFLVSSHCLEHMNDVYTAFENWIRIVKSGGYIVVTVPDEDLYEQGEWPSKYNDDHKWTFAIQKNKSWSEKSINIFELLTKFQDEIEVVKVEKISEFYNYNLSHIDQTINPNIESAIEFIVRKKSDTKIIDIQRNRRHLEIKKNKSFQNQFSELFDNLQKLDRNYKYIVYGYGSAAKMMDMILGNSIIAFIDITSEIITQDIKKEIVYSPNNLINMEYDFIIISVLGRENDIKENLKRRFISADKIISF
jgi:predicted SAM-dependent methyltransferase